MEHQYNQRFWTHKNARFWPPFCNSHRWWQHRVLSDSTTHCSNVYFWNIFSCGVQNMSNSIFLEFFLWLCLLIKAHGNKITCPVMWWKGEGVVIFMNETYIFGTTCFCHFFTMFVWIDIYFICVDIFGYCVHRTAWSFAPGQKGDPCMQVIKQVHLNRMNGLETFQTHH